MALVCCGEGVEVDIDGEAYEVFCNKAAGHPESHSAVIWWNGRGRQRAAVAILAWSP